MRRLPFAGLNRAVCWLPRHADNPFDPISQFCELLTREWAQPQAELGASICFRYGEESASGPGMDEGWCLIGPSGSSPLLKHVTADFGRDAPVGPVVWIDWERRIVALDGPDLDAVGEAFQFLRTATRERVSELTPSFPHSVYDMIATVEREVADTYRAFALRGIDWPAVVVRHRDDLRAESG